MALLLKRVAFRVGPAENSDAQSVQLGGLPFGRRLADLAHYTHAGTHRELLDFAFVIRQFSVRDNLQIAKRRTVVEFDKTESTFGIPPRAHPTPDLDDLTDRRFLACLGDGKVFHLLLLRYETECCRLRTRHTRPPGRSVLLGDLVAVLYFAEIMKTTEAARLKRAAACRFANARATTSRTIRLTQARHFLILSHTSHL